MDTAPGTSRGYDVMAFGLPIASATGLILASRGLPMWSVAATPISAIGGVATAHAVSRMAGDVSGPAQAVALAAVMFVTGLLATAPMRVMIVVLAFLGGLVSAGLLIRRGQLRG